MAANAGAIRQPPTVSRICANSPTGFCNSHNGRALEDELICSSRVPDAAPTTGAHPRTWPASVEAQLGGTTVLNLSLGGASFCYPPCAASAMNPKR